MRKNYLQPFILALVLMFGTLAIVSSISSCRRVDVLDPNDHGNGGRDTNNHRDTTIVRDTNNTNDTVIVRDTNFVDDSGMVINGGFDQNPGTFLPIPRPWLTWYLPGRPPKLGPQWSQVNGCGSGIGSLLLYSDDEDGVMQDLRQPFLQYHRYRVSLCATATPADSAMNPAAQIDLLTSQDGGLTFIWLATVNPNSTEWTNYSTVFTSPVDSKTLYVIVRNPQNTIGGATWVNIDNIHISEQ